MNIVPVRTSIRITQLCFFAAIVLLVALVAYTRGTAPWGYQVINDEMHHLESWRNRYRTDDVYPLFVERVENSGLLKGSKLELFNRIYHSGALAQRGLLVLVDPQPPLYPAMQEIIEATTRSSLLAARLPSAIASALAVWFMYLLGGRLRDRTLGLWLAGMLAISHLAQTYAVVARPYAVAQCTLILVLYMFVRHQRQTYASPWRLWLVALLAQSTQWMVWAIVGPLFVVEFVRRWRSGAGIALLLKQTWWYALLSVFLLCEMLIQLKNPTISGQAGTATSALVWSHFALGSPFASLDSLLGTTGVGVAGFILLAAMLCGVGAALPRLPKNAPLKAGLVLTLAVSLAAPLLIGSTERFMMTYAVVPVVVAGLGIRRLLGDGAWSAGSLAIVLALFGAIRLIQPEDPYQRIHWADTDYRAVAQLIEAELGDGGLWCAHPHFKANCLYRYGDLPEPVMPLNPGEFRAFLETLPREDGPALVFTKTKFADEEPMLRDASQRWEYFNNYVVIRIPPASAE